MAEQTYAPPPVKGYKTLSQEQVDLMNEGNSLGLQVQAWIEKLRSRPDVAPYWLLVGETDMSKGLMACIRAITQPEGL
ncbi:DUF7681 family protein [Caldimonas sp. KR1-144]|uniref:Acb2/Tad1 domain-containing protein n=1 Tax=Caldimonas sp. KR1-144 TaxID=3400911 RepID=UPI003C0130FD